MLHDEVIEVGERVNASGVVEEKLNKREVYSAIKTALESNPKLQAIAICYLNSYKNPRHEVETLKIA